LIPLIIIPTSIHRFVNETCMILQFNTLENLITLLEFTLIPPFNTLENLITLLEFTLIPPILLF